MRQTLPLCIALLLFACSLASWQVVGYLAERCESGIVCKPENKQASLCSVISCESGARVECTAENVCSKNSSEKQDCGQNKDTTSSCCFSCFGNCCYYVLPVHGFQLRPCQEEVVQKPDGLQHLFPQSFYCSVWHPPANVVQTLHNPQEVLSSNFSIPTT